MIIELAEKYSYCLPKYKLTGLDFYTVKDTIHLAIVDDSITYTVRERII